MEVQQPPPEAAGEGDKELVQAPKVEERELTAMEVEAIGEAAAHFGAHTATDDPSAPGEPVSEPHHHHASLGEAAEAALTSAEAAALGDSSEKKKKKATTKRASAGTATQKPAPKRPKRPKTAYHFFFEMRRSEELAKDPERDNNELSHSLGQEWKSLKDKSHYEALAAGARAEYDGACRAYEESSGKRMTDCRPKKPLTAYMLFFQSKHENTEKQHTDFSKQIGALWKAMTAEQKRPFNDKARSLKATYDEQCRLLALAPTDLIGRPFVDALHGTSVTVLAVDLPAAKCTVLVSEKNAASSSSSTGGGGAESGPQIVITLAELRARICGDGKASRRATKQQSSLKKSSSLDNNASSSLGADKIKDPPPSNSGGNDAAGNAADKGGEEKKETTDTPQLTWKTVTKADILPEEDSPNLVRICRRLVGGACVQNLKNMCTALAIDATGPKGLLATRIELYLRSADFKTNPFEPSAKDVETLDLQAFNDKYESKPPLNINDITHVLKAIPVPE